jgi:soluble lytic murein transglycosylase-like protein
MMAADGVQIGFAAALIVELAITCVWLTVSSPAKAEVLEIDAAGVVAVHDGPEVTSQEGSTPIFSAVKSQVLADEAGGNKTDIDDAAAGAALSPDLLEAVAWRESRLYANAVSPAGAIGEMQLMPGTAKDLRVDPHDGRQNLIGGAHYLAGLLRRYDGDVVRALAAYNAGPGAVDRYGGVPPYKETQAYVAAILDRLSQRAAAPER